MWQCWYKKMGSVSKVSKVLSKMSKVRTSNSSQIKVS